MHLNADTDAFELIGGYEQTTDGRGHSRFAWFDSVFVQAFEHGGWVVLDNAQAASAAVLDRLNAALEPNGQMIIGERCVRRHEHFRWGLSDL